MLACHMKRKIVDTMREMLKFTKFKVFFIPLSFYTHNRQNTHSPKDSANDPSMFENKQQLPGVIDKLSQLNTKKVVSNQLN